MRLSYGQVSICLLPALVYVLLMLACRPPVAPTPAEAVDDVRYTVELQACLDKGKAARSRAIYRECAAGVDARWADGGVRP